MGYTISYHTGEIRRISAITVVMKEPVSKEAHIRQNGDFEVWIDENLQDAYKRLFQPAVEDYNKKQRRSDRRKENYYQEIKKAGKKHLVYETILTVGNAQNLPNSDRKGRFQGLRGRIQTPEPEHGNYRRILSCRRTGSTAFASGLDSGTVSLQSRNEGSNIIKGALGEMGISYKDGVLAVTRWKIRSVDSSVPFVRRMAWKSRRKNKLPANIRRKNFMYRSSV